MKLKQELHHSGFHWLWAAFCLAAMTSPFQPANAQGTGSQTNLHKTKPNISLTSDTYLGFKSYRLSDGLTEAVIVPTLGRVMRYGLVNGKNQLWNADGIGVKSGEWRNWGGDKSWPAPQNQWPLSIKYRWPPAPAWDGLPHAATVLPGNKLRLTSGKWPGLGCIVIREFSFDENGNFVIQQTFRKLNGSPVELSIWDIAQVPTPEAVYVLANQESPYKNQFHWIMKPEKTAIRPDINVISPHLLRLRPNGSAPHKIGVDAPVASIAVLNSGVIFRQLAARPSGNYPDGAVGSGFPVELFDAGPLGAKHYIETELLSPLRIYYPGRQWTHSVKWSLHRVRNSEVNSQEYLDEIETLLRSG